MTSEPHPPGPRPASGPRARAVALLACLIVAAVAARSAPAQGPDPIPAPAASPALELAPAAPSEGAFALPSLPGSPALVSDDPSGRVGCPSCGGIGRVPAAQGTGFATCQSCRGAGCVPGRKPCYTYEGHTFVGRFFGELYQSLCCPDPCYEPGWVPTANAAFFADSPRPRTIQRIRNDYNNNLQFPDRSEFFWARQQIQTVDHTTHAFSNLPGGRGPGRPNHYPKNQAYLGTPATSFDQVSFYNEAAASPRVSLFVEIPYRVDRPIYGNFHAGFADMNTGTKGVIFDTELLLLTIQFRTFIPTGNASFGLGTGHVSLEPSLLGALKLGPDTFLQGQLSEWIPIGGDPIYQGAILHTHFALNQVLCRLTPDSPLIGTLEINSWFFQDGAYTDPAIGPYQKSSQDAYHSLGPGLRTSICDGLDFGGAIAFPVSSHWWGDPTYRLEFRILY